MGTSSSDYNDERAKEFAEKADDLAKHKKEYKDEHDAKYRYSKKTEIKLDPEQEALFLERQRKALERREKFLARKNKTK
jgi:hypothetical protein